MMSKFNQYYLTTRLTRKAAHDIYLSYAMHEPGHKILLKIYNAGCRRPDIAPEDFQYHARKFKRLSHPHIVPILDIGIEEGQPYVVSDYFAEGSLRQQMRQMAPQHLPLDTALALILDVGSALSYAHSQGIVHHKVKPENIFLNAQGEALLADFSLHELINEIVLDSNPDDRVINYMAPEQLTGSATASSDQYALACLFYELITGKLPFTAQDLLYRRLGDIIPSSTSPSQFVTTLPKQMESVVLKALSQKPEERYADVAAFLAALEEAVQSTQPAFPSKQIIPRPDVRLPKETLSPAPTVRPASVQEMRREPKSEPLSPSFGVKETERKGPKSEPLFPSFGVKETGQLPVQGDIDVLSPYHTDRVSPLSLSEESTASLWDEALLSSTSLSEWLDDSMAPAVLSKSHEEEVELSQFSYREKEAEHIDQEEEVETAQLPFPEEEIDLTRLPFTKGERTELAQRPFDEEEIDLTQLPLRKEERETRSFWSGKEEQADPAQRPFDEEEIDLTQLPFSKGKRDTRSHWGDKEEQAKRFGLVIKEVQDERPQMRRQEKRAELSNQIEKGEQAAHSQLDDKGGKERHTRLNGKEEESKHPQLNSLEEEEELSSSSFMQSFSQRVDGIQKAGPVSSISSSQEDLEEHNDILISFLTSAPAIQAAPVPDPIVHPAPAPVPDPIVHPAPAPVPDPIVHPAPALVPVPLSGSENIETGLSSSVAESSSVPASPVSSAQLPTSPVVQKFPLSKLTCVLLSLALICIVITAFTATSNRSIISLMNAHTSTQAVSVAVNHPTPTGVTITSAEKELQRTLPTSPEVLLTGLYLISQFLYLFAFATLLYYFILPINWVNTAEAAKIKERDLPRIILLYPVLKEPEETMRTTFLSLSNLKYPPARYRVIAIPNSHDVETIASLKRLEMEFPFLETLAVPPTTDPSWETVWQAWETNPEAYWWHHGKYRKNRDLPPKKTRQLIYAFYTLVAEVGDDWLLDYIDADSITPTDHFMAAAAGMQKYDVLQSTNIAGNLLDTWPASFHAMDHMVWDGFVYPHMSANGKHPFWVLGKGLFFKATDVRAFGSFNPWITIEDPEVGMRLWINGKRMGIIANPLIEEVPVTLKGGIIQRSRWVCGFFQSLSSPLHLMGMSFWQAQRARINLVPTLSLAVNAFGLPIGIWALYQWFNGTSPLPVYWVGLSMLNIAAYVLFMTRIYIATWQRTSLVLSSVWDRVRYLLRVNPIFLWLYWFIWLIPILIGFQMFLRDQGKEWIRTEKVNANRAFVQGKQKVEESAKPQIAARR